MNSIFILFPRRTSHGIWIFDDPTRNLVNEPFVGQTNDLIDQMAEDSGYDLTENLEVALMFSAESFPDFQCNLTLLETSPHGTTYECSVYNLEPWLCPAMFLFFPQAPPKMYGMVKQKPH